MDTYTIATPLALIGVFITLGIIGVYADTDSISVNTTNMSENNLRMNETAISDTESGNITGDLTEGQRLDGSQESGETPAIFNGTEHPNEETDVKSSTPAGNPLIPKFAQGGVNIDIGAHLMEGRDSELNASSVLSMHDHTSTFGYIRTIQKDFHYMGGENPT